MQETLDKIIAIIKEETGIREPINPETNLINDLGFNSFELVDLLGKLEDELNISISDREIAAIITVEDLIRLIEQK